MKDIVSEALKYAERSEQQDTESTECDEFGPLEIAVVGCGEEALTWIDKCFTFPPRTGLFGKHVEFDVATIGIGSPTEIRSEFTVDRVVSTQSITCDDENFQYDIVVILGYLSEADTLASMVKTCQTVLEDTLVISFPVIPTDGLPSIPPSMFQQLVSTSGTTIPFDLAHLSESSEEENQIDQSTLAPLLRTTFGGIRDVLRDLFELFQEPITVPVDMAAVRQIFDTGDATVLYWGTGTRQKPPEDLLQDAISNRSAGCDVATVDRGLSLVRFGAPFTLAEFENLRDCIKTRYQSPSAGQACWQTAGFVTQGFDDQCRVVLLLTGVKLESFTFIQKI